MSEFVSPFSKEEIKRREKSLRSSLASVDLEMSEETIKNSQNDVEAIIKRIATGETTHEQEEKRLLNEFRKLAM